ncbi:hypothetical protein [Enhydrobacter sp.]|jgi:hypothetical protein|uniref:hypothetical protein n=1 Tax=Enhydrobacter sp. TaxID=1894999 RepID=UPI002638431C|nr:hypothetical protein [Enhydrobacter sp.]WIM09106.1 MAG: hypothetical protein OJF58_000057 [Enhydrobacter sp.]
MTSHDNDLPDGALAYRQYEVPMPDGSTASLAFTLGDMTADSVPANYARQHGVVAYGLVSVTDVPDPPRFPLVWTQDRTQIALAVAEEDKDIGDDLKETIGRCMALFFNDIAAELAAQELGVSPPANDRSVH